MRGTTRRVAVAISILTFAILPARLTAQDNRATAASSARAGPSGDAMATYYPDRARRAGIEGHSSVRCEILSSGRLTDCVVLREEPPGYGFGDASVAMAESVFHLATHDDRGLLVAGKTISISILWKLPVQAGTNPAVR